MGSFDEKQSTTAEVRVDDADSVASDKQGRLDTGAALVAGLDEELDPVEADRIRYAINSIFFLLRVH